MIQARAGQPDNTTKPDRALASWEIQSEIPSSHKHIRWPRIAVVCLLSKYRTRLDSTYVRRPRSESSTSAVVVHPGWITNPDRYRRTLIFIVKPATTCCIKAC